MFHVDVPRVRGKMAEKGYNISSTAEKLDVDRNTLTSYLKNPEKMPYNVVSQLAEILCDSSDEATAIFFATDLRCAKVLGNDEITERKDA